jgi:hypothetical protein
LFLPITYLSLIALTSARLPAPLSPNSTIVASYYVSRFATSLKILLQIPVLPYAVLLSVLFCLDAAPLDPRDPDGA